MRLCAYVYFFLIFHLAVPCSANTHTNMNSRIDADNNNIAPCNAIKEVFVVYSTVATNYDAFKSQFGEESIKIMSTWKLQVYASCKSVQTFTTSSTINSARHVNYTHYHGQTQSSRPAQYRRQEPHEKLHQHIGKHNLESVIEGKSVVQLTSFEAFGESDLGKKLEDSYLEIDEVDVDMKHLEHIVTITVLSAKLSHVIAEMSKMKCVAWIEIRRPVIAFNKFAKGVLEAGYAGSRFLDRANFTGAGHIVGVSDTGIDTNHCFFKDVSSSVSYNALNLKHRKIVYYRTYVDSQDDSHGHGTHVAASLAGSYGNHDYNGMLANAKLAFFDIGDSSSQHLSIPSNLASQMLLPMYRTGARVFSNSWGAYGEGANYYSTDARSIDLFMHHYPEALVIFAAGNEGSNGYSSVVSPSLNKNGLSVGSSCNDATSFSMNHDINTYDHLHVNDNDEDASNFTIYIEDYRFSSLFIYEKDERQTSRSSVVDRVAYFSSKGPTADGRLKPDVVGPGWSIVSAGCGTNCGLTKMRGTSMATPIVAAAAVHVRDYFQRGFYPTGTSNSDDGFIPSGALIKAMLIHATTPLFDVADSDGSVSSLNEYPSREAGYGRVQLSRVLNFGSSSSVSLIVIGSAYTQSQGGKRHSQRDYTLKDKSFSQSTKIDNKPPLYVSLTQDNSYFKYKFNSGSCSKDSDCSIRLTMCYTDIVGASGSDQILMNDLDMSVFSESGNKFYPSSVYEKGPLESLTIEDPEENMNYTVTVYAQRLYTSQPFSLVITGDIVECDNGFNWNESIFSIWSWISGESLSGCNFLPSSYALTTLCVRVFSIITIIFTLGAFYQLRRWIYYQLSSFTTWYLSLDVFGMMMASIVLSILLSYIAHWIMSMVTHMLCCKCCRRRPNFASPGAITQTPPQGLHPHNGYRSVIIYNNQQQPPSCGLSMAEIERSCVDRPLIEAPTPTSSASSATPLVYAQAIRDLENNASNYSNSFLQQPSAPPLDATNSAMFPGNSLNSNNSIQRDKNKREAMYA